MRQLVNITAEDAIKSFLVYFFQTKNAHSGIFFANYFFCDTIYYAKAEKREYMRDDGLSQLRTDFFVWAVPLSRVFLTNFTRKNSLVL